MDIFIMILYVVKAEDELNHRSKKWSIIDEINKNSNTLTSI